MLPEGKLQDLLSHFHTMVEYGYTDSYLDEMHPFELELQSIVIIGINNDRKANAT
ncbi:hypothetical protein CPT_Mendera_055 [Stenotrophomonas phage Mendera]|uniref:Uncharacterized protein n=4 Tax=Menderavirus TaxID=2843421 RepID=A0A482IB90_9CAUD|nr:hypothetical protein HWC11_gp060 [Stenotrophomonas phage YB07]YP_009850762.1 hypothetical protein HWC58_gp055 [Stenotrophomonas phage Moby]YP_009851112.1 hypothetical protein HWC60_gp055 [Stenotrophomonas phage Mendera]YP_010667632.1 hypothetical protein PQC01_gp153 [Stenotrophomonas maltophilia phage vB_SmaM_Ps15]QXN67429.1 hypothetical protein [Stenotrophomonas phage BUCT608]QYW02602.1 hypothetical protein CPT_Marzo_060 [Stenotrophomonas phage Marzo]QBP06256.1 hypothetical protein [Steno